ncbi:winged helix-turn-helix transcriptional regulator [Microlunatus sp. Gsoil 973]|uniref:winged helix-turn-helix transcriptional regulator n=1 Tax=Microlunatus sp. Gsoil 973 TaxID=2672569 RepID=UPI001E439137|nr:winged helix-turn-helix transcriptional regulator [Microlunatus sp. Gsoil 973]
MVAKLEGHGHPEYELTPVGVALHPVLMSLSAWGREYANPERRPSRILTHLCGTRLDDAARCPTCDVTPPPGDVVSTPDPDNPGRRTDRVSVALRRPHRLLEPVRG